MPHYRNKSGVRLSMQVAGRKGLTFANAGDVVEFKDAELEQVKADYHFDKYFEEVELKSNEEAQEMVAKGEAVPGPEVSAEEVAAEEGKPSKSKKKK